MTATYKPIAQKDIGLLVPMMQDFYAIDGYPFDEKDAGELFTEFILNENLGKAWLIIVDGQLAGYIVLTFIFSFEYKGRIAFLDELYIKEHMRGQGIGKTAIKFIRSQVVDLALKLVYLEVEPENHHAQKLYLASGFEVHNRKLLKYQNTNQ